MKNLMLTLGLFAFGCSGEADIGSSNQQVKLCDPETTVLASGLDEPVGIVVDRVAVYVTLKGMGSVIRIAK